MARVDLVYSWGSRAANEGAAHREPLKDSSILQGTIECHEDAWLTAILEHIRDYAPGGLGDCSWARACMSNGKFSVVREDMHNLFEGAEIPETRKWCLDQVVSWYQQIRRASLLW
jgi:hypothetical protein